MNLEKYKKYGNFKLSGGEYSDHYYDLKEAMGEPNVLRQMVNQIIGDHLHKNIDVIIGLDYGGVPLAVALSLATDIPFAVLRKAPKEHGMKKRIEGYQKIGRALLLDDVITSGKSINEATIYLTSLGYTIVQPYTILVRPSWSDINMDAREKYENEYVIEENTV